MERGEMRVRCFHVSTYATLIDTPYNAAQNRVAAPRPSTRRCTKIEHPVQYLPIHQLAKKPTTPLSSLHALISTHSAQPKDRARHLDLALPVSVGSRSLQVHWDIRPAKSGCSLDAGLAVALVVAGVERSPVASLAVVYCPTAVAGEADPMVGAVDVALAVERRIAGVQVGRRGCTGYGLRDCSLRMTATSGVDASIVAGSFLVWAEEVDCSR